MRVKTQAKLPGFEEFVENNLFSRKHVIFSQIHVVGSNNDLRPWNEIDANDSFEVPRPDRLEEFQTREQAAIHWLQHTFRVANRRNARGIFLTIHANPRFDLNHGEQDRAGFNKFLSKLLDLTKKFKKPVVLAHGDFHVFMVDSPRLVPFYANADATGPEDNMIIPNLTRVQIFGDSDNHWIKVEVDPNDKDVFRIVKQIVKSNL